MTQDRATGTAAPSEGEALNGIWDSKLRPLFRETRAEARRRQRVSRISGAGLVLIGLAAALVLWIYPPFPETSLWIPPLVAFGLCAFLAALVAQENRRGFNARLKARLMPALAGSMEMRHDPKPATDFVDLAAVASQRMIDHFSHVTLEDGLSGNWRGMGFRWVEAELTAPKGGSTNGPGAGPNDRRRVSFRGIVMEVQTPHRMPWILFQPETQEPPADSHRTSHRDGTELTRMQFARDDGEGGVGDGNLPGGYAIYAEDPAAAHAAIGAQFAETLALIARRHGRPNRPVSGFFRDGCFTLLMRYDRPFLEVDVYNVEEAGFAAACRAALEDLTMVRQVIDLLMDGPGQDAQDTPAASAAQAGPDDPSDKAEKPRRHGASADHGGDASYHPEEEPGP